MAFRPCIDLRDGRVVQIVGGTLSDDGAQTVTNHVSDRGAAEFAALYRRDGLRGGHVILLGPGNEGAARSALAAYPGGLQVGGGVTPENAGAWLDAGASHVIVLLPLPRRRLRPRPPARHDPGRGPLPAGRRPLLPPHA